jgi:hypothetical protein
MQNRPVRTAIRVGALLTGALLGLGSISAQAGVVTSGGTVTLDASSFSYSAAAGDEQTNAISNSGDATQLPVSVNVVPPSAYGFGGGASVMITASPLVNVMATISNNCGAGACIGYASANGSLTYSVEVVPFPSTGDPYSGPIPVLMSGSYNISSTLFNNSASALVQSSDGTQVLFNQTFPANLSQYSSTLSLLVFSEYMVTINATAAVGGILGSASTSIDPMFTIDPSFAYAGDYQLLFSPGIQNDVSNTPLPATLPLFAGGLGAMGLFGWRSKRKALAA